MLLHLRWKSKYTKHADSHRDEFRFEVWIWHAWSITGGIDKLNWFGSPEWWCHWVYCFAKLQNSMSLHLCSNIDGWKPVLRDHRCTPSQRCQSYLCCYSTSEGDDLQKQLSLLHHHQCCKSGAQLSSVRESDLKKAREHAHMSKASTRHESNRLACKYAN